jgi:hypothetical protein
MVEAFTVYILGSSLALTRGYKIPTIGFKADSALDLFTNPRFKVNFARLRLGWWRN